MNIEANGRKLIGSGRRMKRRRIFIKIMISLSNGCFCGTEECVDMESWDHDMDGFSSNSF